MHRSHGLQHLRHKRLTFASADKSGYTLGFRRKIAHSGSHGEIGVFRTGVVSLPSERSARSQTSPGRVSERCTLPLLGLGRGCSRRTQRACGAAMCLCASLLRGVAAPLGCVICLQFGDVAVFSLCAQYFLNVRGEGGVTTLGVLCVLLKRWTAACQSGYPAILFVPRKSSEINPNSSPILIVPFPTFPGKAIHSGSQSEAGHRSLLMLFLFILRLVDIFPTIW